MFQCLKGGQTRIRPVLPLPKRLTKVVQGCYFGVALEGYLFDWCSEPCVIGQS